MRPVPRSRVPILSVLRNRNFRTLWYAGSLIESLRRTELLVLSILVLQDTNSPFQLALILVFFNLPRSMFSLLTGAVAERFSRQHVLVVGQSTNMLVAAGLLSLMATDEIQPWHAFVAVFWQGGIKCLEDPSRRTAIFDIVGQRRLVNAMSLDVVTITAGRMVGPVLGGVLVSLVDNTGAYSFVLVVHAVALALLFRVRIPHAIRSDSAEPVWTSLMVAIRYALHSPVLLGLLYVTFLMNGLGFPVQQFIPAIGLDHLGVGPALIGLLASAEGFGALLGTVVIGSMRSHRYHGRVYVMGSAVGLVMAILFVWSPWYGLSFALLTFVGVGWAGFSTMQSTITMLSSPPEIRGRMLGLSSMSIGVGTPLGALEIGLVAAAFSTQWAISVNALAALLLFVPAIALTPLIWRPLASSLPETAKG